MLSVTPREERIEHQYLCAANEIMRRTQHADAFKSIMERLRSNEFVDALTRRGMTSEYAACKLRVDFCWIIINRHHNFRPNREIHSRGMPIPQSMLNPGQALIDDLIGFGANTRFPDTFKRIKDFLNSNFLEIGAQAAPPRPPERHSVSGEALAL